MTNADDDASLADLRAQFRKPVVVPHSSIAYHNMSKKERGDLKKSLTYFVGGTIQGKRHDSNVQARTLLTLDVEAKEGQAPPPPPEDVFDTLEALGREGWVYTSISHTPKAPRYRVVLPLAEPLEGDALTEEALQASTQTAAAMLDIEEWCTRESWVPSQPMYAPAKLKDAVFWEAYAEGAPWKASRGKKSDSRAADLPLERMDPVLLALQRAGAYLGAAAKHQGMHYIRCPWADEHSTDNASKTVYYEAHHDGNPRPACKCMSTSHDELTYGKLVQWLREEGHLTKADENTDTEAVLDEYDVFQAKAQIGQWLTEIPDVREFAWDKFAPVGKVTVLAGPGGVSKSMLMLHLLVYGALGRSWGGFNVTGPLRGMYVSYEDDKLELHKRVYGLAQALREADDGLGDVLYDVTGTLQKNLSLYAADEEAVQWMLMVKKDQRGAAERTARVEWLIGYLRYAKIKAVVLDPVVYTHNLEESAPGDMAVYMQTLTHIAKQSNCAVIVLHHMHKTAQWASLEEVNQGSLRGASSFADNSRSVGVMVSMPPKDAARFGLASDAGKSLAVFKHVKHNYSAGMETQMFERRGPLLVPRNDIQMLDRGELDARAEAEKARQKSAAIESRVAVVLGWILDNGQDATSNMIRLGVGMRHGIFKEITELAEENEWLSVTPGPNKSLVYRVTSDGKKWYKSRKGAL